MATRYIPDEHHLIRSVPWARLRKDADDNVLGVDGIAFRLREAEEYLSATWLEFFDHARREDQLQAAVRSIRKSNMKPSPRSGFALGQVRRIAAVCKERGRKIRVIHERTPDNEAHVAVRQWPRDDEELFQLLATDAWSELVMNADVPV